MKGKKKECSCVRYLVQDVRRIWIRTIIAKEQWKLVVGYINHPAPNN